MGYMGVTIIQMNIFGGGGGKSVLDYISYENRVWVYIHAYIMYSLLKLLSWWDVDTMWLPITQADHQRVAIGCGL